MQLKIRCLVCKKAYLQDNCRTADCPKCGLSLLLQDSFISLLNHIEDSNDKECYEKAIYKLNYHKTDLVLTYMCEYKMEIANISKINADDIEKYNL